LFYVELRDRIKRFAVRVFNLIDHIPDTPKGRVIQRQLAAAASSAAANYRALNGPDLGRNSSPN